MFESAGRKFMSLKGGPDFTFNPSISFRKLLDGGTGLIPLDKYGWSTKYGWLQGRFGKTFLWQWILFLLNINGYKIVITCLRFIPVHLFFYYIYMIINSCNFLLNIKIINRGNKYKYL